jgi:hypothetical protein
MKEDIGDKLQREFEENEKATFYAFLKIAILMFIFGLIYLNFK